MNTYNFRSDWFRLILNQIWAKWADRPMCKIDDWSAALRYFMIMIILYNWSDFEITLSIDNLWLYLNYQLKSLCVGYWSNSLSTIDRLLLLKKINRKINWSFFEACTRSDFSSRPIRIILIKLVSIAWNWLMAFQ